MPVKKESSGRRSVEAEIEVPGTPEAVWEAIATGPGISAWFVPSTVDGRVGGKTIQHFAPDSSMDSVGAITEWQPPHRFVATTEEEMGTVASEWTVEARAGGTCTVRIVHSWFAEGDDWDDQYEGHAAGWASFFKILKLYLEHFPGERSALVQTAAKFEGSVAEAFERLMGPLGIGPGSEGQRTTAGPDGPELAGRVLEAPNGPEGFSVIMLVDRPARAIAHMIGFPMGGPIHISVRFYLYGAEAMARAGEIESFWSGWLAERFPAR
ncbi:SRPBCC family protein [Pelagibacterium lacus]|uniref:SRPBCC domain-containing protein n=1 Tax=Pelagibacterium lacus TaxID=2282655 RepID=A0A369W6I6_9HYPH|nr:SRPBCC domain-containing protein [Pelagibacterium lacus]RDE10296.1 SRPBCC domain-containing protein [Pelagibacterium lacus]